MSQQKYSRAGVASTLLICCALSAISLLLIFNKQRVIDQIIVWQYVPTSEISALANRSGMSDYGEFLFFASQPKLDATQNFNIECDRVEAITSILGCYSNSRIFIYDVTDAQLDGIREVTAAHETLHAVYVRMNDDVKSKIDALLETEYKKLENDKNFTERMAFYDRAEPGQRDNELHSVIGTEVAGISPALEAHYSEYFSNRQQVVALNTKYSSVFQELENRANKLSEQLNELASSVSDRVSQYNTEVKALNSDIITFNNRVDSGEISSQTQLNSERYVLTTRVSGLDAMRTGINNDIKTYDSILAEYNSIASQSKKLNNSIDSTLAPAPSV